MSARLGLAIGVASVLLASSCTSHAPVHPPALGFSVEGAAGRGRTFHAERTARRVALDAGAPCGTLAPSVTELGDAMAALHARYFRDGRRALPGVGFEREGSVPSGKRFVPASLWVPDEETGAVPRDMSEPIPIFDAETAAVLAPALAPGLRTLPPDEAISITLSPADAEGTPGHDDETQLHLSCEGTAHGAAGRLVWKLERLGGKPVRNRGTGDPVMTYVHDGHRYDWIVLFPRRGPGPGDFGAAETALER